MLGVTAAARGRLARISYTLLIYSVPAARPADAPEESAPLREWIRSRGRRAIVLGASELHFAAAESATFAAAVEQWTGCDIRPLMQEGLYGVASAEADFGSLGSVEATKAVAAFDAAFTSCNDSGLVRAERDHRMARERIVTQVRVLRNLVAVAVREGSTVVGLYE